MVVYNFAFEAIDIEIFKPFVMVMRVVDSLESNTVSKRTYFNVYRWSCLCMLIP